MFSNEFENLANTLLDEFRNHNGTVSLCGVRMAREVFQYVEGAEHVIGVFALPRNWENPDSFIDMMASEIDDERAARIAAGVLDPSDNL